MVGGLCLEREIEMRPGIFPIEGLKTIEMIKYEEEWKCKKSMALAPETGGLIVALPLSSCVALEQQYNLSDSISSLPNSVILSFIGL